jgi:tetratricopeptide (TPR) repeat protein
MKRLLVVALLLSGFAIADDADAAQKAYQAKQWKDAATMYGKLTQAEPKNPLYWYRLGTSLRMAGDMPKAEAALTQAQQLGFQPMMVNLGLAAVAVRNGDSEKALVIVEDLAKKGFPAAPIIENDPAFASLSSQPRFVAVLDSMKEQAAPCKYPQKNPQYRQFDFWVGNWDVYGKGGALVGHSHVDLILGKCVVSENWTDMTGGEGKSYNKYNAPLQRWEQYWVDQYGQTTFYAGRLEGPNMVYLADGFSPAGKPQKQRLTFFPLGPDKVRQFGESSDDGGTTWKVAYDLTYIRQKNDASTAGK